MESVNVRVVIPHYFSEKSDGEDLEIGEGCGSRAQGGSFYRQISFFRSLRSLLNLRRHSKDLILDMCTGNASLTSLQLNSLCPFQIKIEINVATFSNFVLHDVLNSFSTTLKVIQPPCDDPKLLGIVARDWLINHPKPALVNIYMEDDLIIHDSLFIDKIIWMAQQSNHLAVLMPHRYEITTRSDIPPKLYIDGPINHEEISSWHQPVESFAEAQFKCWKNLIFDIPSNPHSGFFAVTNQQLAILRDEALPTGNFFVGPLETAATATVACYFKLLKPAIVNRSFFEIEHGYPSYLGYLRKLSFTN